MKWINDGDIFEKELLEFFLNDKFTHIVFPKFNGNGNSIRKDKAKFCLPHASHSHPFTEIMIVLEGSSILESDGREYYLEKGTIGVVEGKFLHRENAVDEHTNYRVAYISFAKDRVWFSTTRFDKTSGFKYQMAAPTLIIDEPLLIKQMEEEISRRSVDFEPFFYNFLKAFYLYVYRNKMTTDSENITVDRISDISLIIENYIRKNFMDKSIIKAICRHLHMSEPALCNFVKKYMNTTLSHFINLTRIENAKNLLERTNRKVWEVANEVGYTDQYYFSKIFRVFAGMTPSEFRTSTNRTLY